MLGQLAEGDLKRVDVIERSGQHWANVRGKGKE